MRGIISLVLVLSLGACGSSARPPSGPATHAFPGYFDVSESAGQSIPATAGTQGAQIAIVNAKDSSATKLVWIDASGSWHEIMTAPKTMAVDPDGTSADCSNGAACETVNLHPLGLRSAQDMLTFQASASGRDSDYWITWLLHWDATQSTFVADKATIQRVAKVQPSAGAVQSAPSLSVTWKDSSNSEDAGAYITSGFPAVSADGTAVLLAVQGADDARGTPHLTLIATDARNAVLEKFVLPKLPRDTAAVHATPSQAALSGAAEFLQASVAKHGWHPLAWRSVSLREHGAKVTVDGFELSLQGSEDKLRISKSGTVILDNIDLAAKHSLSCSGEPHVSGIAIDEPHSLAVISATLVSRDGCYPDPVFAVHSWAKPRS